MFTNQNLSNNLIHRADDNMWSLYLDKAELHSSSLSQNDREKTVPINDKQYLEVRLQAESFKVAQYSAAIIRDLGSKNIDSLLSPQYLDIQNYASTKRWKMSICNQENSYLTEMKQFIPFTKMLTEKNVIKINIDPVADGFFSKLLERLSFQKTDISNVYHIKVDTTAFSPMTSHFNTDESISEKIIRPPFGDAFSKVATDAFQRWESYFVPQNTLNSDYRIVLNNQNIYLKSNASPLMSFEEKAENRTTIKAFRHFLRKEYGIEKVQYIQYQMNINLDNMIHNAQPLLPEHVYRINIAANNIEMQDIEHLYEKLLMLKQAMTSLDPQNTLFNILRFHSAHRSYNNFSVREFRSLFYYMTTCLDTTLSMQEYTVQDLNNVLDQLIGEEPPHTVNLLPKESFNQLVEFLMPTDPHAIYTGREIIHKAIMGFYTMADRNQFKPWVDLQELLQCFKDLEKQEDWSNYYEMLSHVIVKKHLIRQHPSEGWRVGALIPGPRDKDNNKRWYRVNSCTDDNEGDFNYTLVPSCQDYTGMPAIKLYRSTASDPYAMNGWDSVAADLKLAGAPGAGNRSSADEYEMPFFQRRTIPIWVAYYLKANDLMSSSVQTDSESYFQQLSKAASIYVKSYQLMDTDTDKRFNIPTDNTKDNIEFLKNMITQLKQKLFYTADQQKELPQYKMAHDIAFVGHSLGGALSQGGFFHFGPEQGRVPLPNKNFICYASDPPAILETESSYFFEFGKEHQELLQWMGQKWKIIIQMEYGDVVAEAGERHLAATKRPPSDYENWLETDISVFKPLETAVAKEISTAPTHGRRIGLAKENLDYSLFRLTPKDLYDFDHAWWLDGKLQKTFGYQIVNSPKFAELARKALALIRIPFGQTAKWTWQYFKPPRGHEIRDCDGYLHVNYHPTTS